MSGRKEERRKERMIVIWIRRLVNAIVILTWALTAHMSIRDGFDDEYTYTVIVGSLGIAVALKAT